MSNYNKAIQYLSQKYKEQLDHRGGIPPTLNTSCYKDKLIHLLVYQHSADRSGRIEQELGDALNLKLVNE